jgi:hypothetical protein
LELLEKDGVERTYPVLLLLGNSCLELKPDFILSLTRSGIVLAKRGISTTLRNITVRLST